MRLSHILPVFLTLVLSSEAVNPYVGYELLDPITGRVRQPSNPQRRLLSTIQSLGSGYRRTQRQVNPQIRSFNAISYRRSQDPEKSYFSSFPQRQRFDNFFRYLEPVGYENYFRQSRNIDAERLEGDNSSSKYVSDLGKPAYKKRKRYPYYGRKKRSTGSNGPWTILDPVTGRIVGGEVSKPSRKHPSSLLFTEEEQFLQAKPRPGRENKKGTVHNNDALLLADNNSRTPAYKKYRKNPYRG